ncbi:MAG: ZIP family metal transporter [Chloroflexi bacterium]|nr:ZIP family metal transporter [Chloroflexota bacterium]
MIAWLEQFGPVTQALIATLFTWFVTALGAGLVLFTKSVSRRLLDSMLGMAAGVMTAASFWSLLAPAIDMSGGSFVPALIGFLLGGAVLRVIDQLLPHVHPALRSGEIEGVPTSWQRSTLLILAVTLHNIPEGLAVGVAFGAAAVGMAESSLAGAVALAIGIGLQNFPEGTAVSFPLRRENISRGKAFFWGQLSGMVEPIAGVIGAWAVVTMRAILPYALAFAAGAMIYVVIEELIPEAQSEGHGHLATIGAMLGFAVMMTLDVALG